MSEENVSLGDLQEKPAEAGAVPEVSELTNLLNKYPEWTKGWAASIVNWGLTHDEPLPIFINPITEEPQWINRATRRKWQRRKHVSNK